MPEIIDHLDIDDNFFSHQDNLDYCESQPDETVSF